MGAALTGLPAGRTAKPSGGKGVRRLPTSKLPPAPRGLGDAGKELWKAVVKDYEMHPHELALLEEAAHTRDLVAELNRAIAKDGVMIDGLHGKRLSGAVAEIRGQRLTLARLLASLGVPPLDDDLPNSRGVRGVYLPGRRK